MRLSRDPAYWVLPGSNYNNWRYSELGQINNKNAGRLELAWTFATGSLRNHAGGPLVLPAASTGLGSDTLFVHTPYPNEVLAINLDTLELVWSYHSGSEAAADCCQSTNFGISYANGRIFLQQDDHILVAINARNGRAAWKTRTGFGQQGFANINVPYPVNNLVLSNIFDVNGVSVALGAYRMNDGGLVWKAGSVGGDNDILFDQNTTQLGSRIESNSSSISWQAEQFPRSNYRSAPWLAWDQSENLVYYGSAADPQSDPSRRPGERKWTATIFARDLNTGMARWVYQMTPNNEWGFNGINEMILANLIVNERQVPALVHFDHNGYAYILERVTGMLLKGDKYDPAVSWSTHINLSTGKPMPDNNASRYFSSNSGNIPVCPAAEGAKAESPSAFSPRTGYFYLPRSLTCMVHDTRGNQFTPALDPEIGDAGTRQGEHRVIPASGDGSANLGSVAAWDAAQAKPVWSVPERWPVRSGVLATGGDVVVYGTLDGYVKLLDAKTGSMLWQFRAPSGIAGNVSSWMHKGKQYIGVLTGVDPYALAELGLQDAELYAALRNTIRSGGSLLVFSLP